MAARADAPYWERHLLSPSVFNSLPEDASPSSDGISSEDQPILRRFQRKRPLQHDKCNSMAAAPRPRPISGSPAPSALLLAPPSRSSAIVAVPAPRPAGSGARLATPGSVFQVQQSAVPGPRPWWFSHLLSPSAFSPRHADGFQVASLRSAQSRAPPSPTPSALHAPASALGGSQIAVVSMQPLASPTAPSSAATGPDTSPPADGGEEPSTALVQLPPPAPGPPAPDPPASVGAARQEPATFCHHWPSVAPPPPWISSLAANVQASTPGRPASISVPIRPIGDLHPCPRREIRNGPGVPLTVAPAARNLVTLKGKGSKWAARCPGPWVSALDGMPEPPLVGSKRASAGLAGVPLTRDEKRAIEQERAARTLVAILPYGCAAYVLFSTDDYVAATPPEHVAEQMVGILSEFGTSSLSAAAAALGAFLAWMQTAHPGTQTALGNHFAEYLKTHRASKTAFKWLRDWCGIHNPARSAVFRGATSAPGPSPAVGGYAKGAFTLRIVIGLEEIVATDPSPFVRGHAAAWYLLAMAALRCEQAADCCLVAIVHHSCDGLRGTIFFLACARDKHPDPSKACARPVWAPVSGIRRPGVVADELAVLYRDTADARCLLPDTDSASGSPRDASAWMLGPRDASSSSNTSLSPR
jgi:hypothetical protein